MNAPRRRFPSQAWKCGLWQGVDVLWTSLLRLMGQLRAKVSRKSKWHEPELLTRNLHAQFIDVYGRMRCSWDASGRVQSNKTGLGAKHSRGAHRLELPTGTRGPAA